MNNTYSITQSEEAQRTFFYKVYLWMAGALTLTALVAGQIYISPLIRNLVVENPMIFLGALIAELILVVAISAGINKMSALTATVLFLIYAALNGVTFSLIFMAYTQASIAATFLITAGTFGITSAFGYFTKRDLTTAGGFLTMALIGLILASVVNMFLNNPMLYWIISYVGVLIFVGLTAYDTQKIKEASTQFEEGSEAYIKSAVMGALVLYLDFINLFLLLLRILGVRRED